MMALPAHEQSVLDRLAKANPLGWRPWKRNERGQAILRTSVPGRPGELRIVYMVLTPEGILYYQSKVTVNG